MDTYEGQLKLEERQDKRIKHGYRYTKIYSLWENIKKRCQNKNRINYYLYGGKGIKLCDEWQQPLPFIQWAFNNGWKDGLKIDRIDNNGDYCPENCRFITNKENNWNKRNNRVLKIGGISKCISEWADIANIKVKTVYNWIYRHGEDYTISKLKERLDNE